jgi:hypothetical protein
MSQDEWRHVIQGRSHEVARFLSWANTYEESGASLRWSKRQDIQDAATASHWFEEQWWGLVVFSCFGRLEGAKFVAPLFPRPRPDAAAVLAELQLPAGSIGHHRVQTGHRGAKQALVAACERSDEFERILARGLDFRSRYLDLRALWAPNWGRTTCFDLVLRAGALGVGGQTYGPDRAYLETGPARGFALVTGIEVATADSEWCEGLLHWWSENWNEVADVVGVDWHAGDAYDSGDFENALCIYQEQSGRQVALPPSASDLTSQSAGSAGQNDGRCPRCGRSLLSVLWDGKAGGGEYLECQSCGWRTVVDGAAPER